VKYCLDKLHVILNALSRLLVAKSSAKVNFDDLETLDLDTYYDGIANLELSNQIYVY